MELDYSSYAVFCLVLLVVHMIQGITGFGAVALALPMLVFFFPIKTLIPALLLVNLLQMAWFAWTERKHIHSGQARIILAFTLGAIPLGYAAYRYVPAEQLKLVLGGVITFIAAWNLAGFSLARVVPLSLYKLLIVLGGFTQGALGSGGPFVVIYATRALDGKSEFRATLSLVWTVLDSLLCLIYLVSGTYRREMLPLVALAVPCMALGTLLGVIIHERVPEKPFQKMVFILLLSAGLILLRPLFF